MLGAVLSMLMSVTWVVLVLPALSRALPPALWPEPSVLRVTGPEHDFTPERASVQAKLTVTSVLFQPLPLAAGMRLPVTDGLVRSMLMSSTVVLSLLPLLSVTWPVTLWPAPSAITVTGLWQFRGGKPPSQVKVTLTAVLFQPSALAAGERLPTMLSGAPRPERGATSSRQESR